MILDGHGPRCPHCERPIARVGELCPECDSDQLHASPNRTAPPMDAAASDRDGVSKVPDARNTMNDAVQLDH